MEKEKILRQLEEKLLPSVKNLDEGQANEHDFFPALLWLLLEKIKDSENQLKTSISTNRDGFKQTVNYIVTKNQDLQKEINQIIDKDIQKNEEFKSYFNIEIEKLSKKIEEQEFKSSKHFKWILGFCVFQFIVLTSLIAFILMKSL